MPGAYTHYIISRQAISSLPPCKLREIVSRCRRLCSLGSQGPDIFFYYVPISRHSDSRNIGSAMHENSPALFLQNAIQRIYDFPSDKERGYAAAYLAGFISHYICDSICHPYIYSRINYNPDHPGQNRYLMHGKLEKQLDGLFADSFPEIIPKDFDMTEAVSISEEELAFLSYYMPDIINKTYFQNHVKSNFRLTPGMTRRTILFFARAMHVRKISEKSDRLYNPSWAVNINHETWQNPWNPSLESNASFPDLTVQTLQKCVLCFQRFDECLCSGDKESREKTLFHFLNTAGNLSYHSGLVIPQ